MGTRLLPATKEQPKEMLPVFARNIDGKTSLKPLLQLVYEQLYDWGIKQFCFITGRGKRAIQDHFTRDYDFLEMLNESGKENQATDLTRFYQRLENSAVFWVNQPEPKGFGDAVLHAKAFVGEHSFLTHAGDTLILSHGSRHLTRLNKLFHELNANCALLVQQIEDPRQYGIIECEEETEGILSATRAVEKPAHPTSNLAILPVYIFKPTIFNALSKTPSGVGGELQLTDGIQTLIQEHGRVYALRIEKDETRLDIGNPETYHTALTISYKASTAMSNNLGIGAK